MNMIEHPDWDSARQRKYLQDKYGAEMISKCMVELFTLLGKVEELNVELAGVSGEGPAYNDVVQEIVSATQRYYQFIGGVPDDLRQYLLYMADTGEVDRKEAEEIRRLLGGSSSLPSSPLLSAQAIRPKNYIMQIDAITNQLPNLGEQTQLRVGRRGNRPVRTTVTLDMPDHMKIEGGEVLSIYDKSIINGVTSLLESGNTVFSVPMLYHAMTGRQNPTIDEQLYEEISGKLEKMRRMMLTIDLSEENDAQYITDENGDVQPLTEVKLEGYLLPLNKVTGKINGKATELYQIIQHPPLYTYSKMRRQLASVRIALLGAPINNNSTTIPLKTYLIQRIELMKNEHNSISSTTILYESIYKELAAEEASKTKKARIRNYTGIILTYFIEQRYIHSFVEFKKGRTISGIHITV